MNSFATRCALAISAVLGLGAAVLVLPAPRQARASQEPSAVDARQRAAPRPTEHRLDADAEARNKAGRRAWMESMHRVPPGVDWRAIERQNGLDAMARRQARILGQAPASAGGSWKELGSRNQAGRMHTARLSSDGSTLYAGSSLGGVWAANPDGTQWRPLGDNLYGGAHEIAVVPGGTGQPDVLIRLAGDLIHRSTDLGQTWSAPTGLNSVSATGRILVLDDVNSTVLLIAYGPTQVGSKWNLYRSSNRGLSFARAREIGSARPDLWTPRDALGPVYLAERNQIYMSNDGGFSFSALGAAIPKTGTTAVLSATTQPTLRFDLALRVNQHWELWRSPDGGSSWAYRRDLDDFWETMETSTQDANLVAYGGVELWVSRNGGVNWRRQNRWGDYYGDPAGKLHADLPGAWVVPDASAPGGEVWFIATDGGLYRSLDQLATVENLSLAGLGVSQYHDVHTSRRNPQLVLAGSQDQGYQRADLSLSSQSGGPWADFDQLISGDYGHLSSADGSHDYVFSNYPGFVLIQDGEQSPQLWTADFPAGASLLWLPPVVADPRDRDAFFLCAEQLYRYDQTTSNSNVWTHSLHGTHDFSPAVVSALAFSPLDPDLAWAATDRGDLYYSTDGALTWTSSADPGPGSHYFYGNALLPSALDPDTVYVGGSGYGNPAVKVSRDGGRTWQAMNTGLTRTLVYGLAEAPDASGDVYAAAESGAWRYQASTGAWEDLLGSVAPLTLYWSVESVPAQNLVRFGTYGRGVWDYHLETPGFFPYGELRGGANTLEMRGAPAPRIGQQVSLTVSGGPAAANGKLIVSRRAADLAQYGGTVLVDVAGALSFNLTADAMGVATLTLSIPNLAALIGQERFLQAALLDASQPSGWALSHGLRAVLGG